MEYAQAVLVIVGGVIALAWIILPFVVMGIKPLLRDLLDEARRANKALLAMAPPPPPEQESPPQRTAPAIPQARLTSSRPPWEK